MTTEHAPNEALAILADRTSTRLPRSLVGALFDIGLRQGSDANSVEWASIDIARSMLGIKRGRRAPACQA
jgi:hypothetical protein